MDLSPLESAACMYSDLYKDVHGFRPRHVKFSSVAEYDDAILVLAADLNTMMAQEEQAKIARKAKYNAMLAQMMVQHGIDRATAIRWDMQAEGVQMDWPTDIEHYFFNNGLLHCMQDYGF